MAKRARRRKKLWFRLPAIAVIGLAVAYVWHGTTESGRYWYFLHSTQLVIDGEEVTVTGVLECKRRFLVIAGPRYGLQGDMAAARKLDGDRSVVVFTGAPCNDPWRWKRSEPNSDFRPVVYLLDNREAPSRIEQYFTETHFTGDPSHMRLTSYRMMSLGGFPIRRYDLLLRYRWRHSLGGEAPWLNAGRSSRYFGYTLGLHRIEDLRPEEQEALEPYLDPNELVQLSWEQIEGNEALEAIRARSEPRQGAGGYWKECPERISRDSSRACEARMATLGLPIENGTPTFRGPQMLLPYVPLTPCEDVPRVELPKPYPVVYNLLGQTVTILSYNLWESLFVDAKRGIVFIPGRTETSADGLTKGRVGRFFGCAELIPYSERFPRYHHGTQTQSDDADGGTN